MKTHKIATKDSRNIDDFADCGEDIKEEIKEAILEGRIQNNPDEARRLMFEIAREKGLYPIQKP